MKSKAAAKGRRLTGQSDVEEWNRAYRAAIGSGPAAVARFKEKLDRIITPVIEKKIKEALNPDKVTGFHRELFAPFIELKKKGAAKRR